MKLPSWFLTVALLLGLICTVAARPYEDMDEPDSSLENDGVFGRPFQRMGTKRELTESVMVCVPCFILPVLVVIYVRFIQPLILRFVPDAWKAKIDSWLYPTCPVNIKKRNKDVKNVAAAEGETEAEAEISPSTEEEKKAQ